MSNKGDYSAVVEVDDDLIPETPQLEFQDFPLDGQSGSSAPAGLTGSISPSNQPKTFGPTDFNNNNGGSNGSQPSNSWFSISYYAQYFDMDTDEVLGRLWSAALFARGGERFVDTISHKPDLYVPFWGAVSLVSVMFAVSSLFESAMAYPNNAKADYDFNQVWTSMATIYFYTFLTPTLLYFTSRYLGARPVLFEFLCVYGYSLISWFPVVVFCSIPYEWLRWIVVILGTGYSGFFLARNVYPTLKQAESSAVRSGLVLAVVAAHIIFALVLKIHYLSYHVAQPADKDVPKNEA